MAGGSLGRAQCGDEVAVPKAHCSTQSARRRRARRRRPAGGAPAEPPNPRLIFSEFGGASRHCL